MDAGSRKQFAMKKNQFKCIVPGCRSSTSTNIAKLHSFPWRDMPRAEKWITAVGCLELLGAPPKALLRLRVCDLHFDKKLKRGKNMKLWDNSAVPTLKLDTVKKAKNGKRPPRRRVKKEKMEIEVDAIPEADRNPETSSNGAANVTIPTIATNGSAAPTPIRLPRELARFLFLREKMQLMNAARTGYDKRFAVFALNLHLSCPSAYRVLRKSLRLPPPGLLLRVDLGIGTRIDTDLVRCFRSKMEKIDSDQRECVLCIDEVELTKKLFYAIDKDEIVGLEEIAGVARAAPASRALALVARGLRGTWTQPLGYFYLADDTDARDLVRPLRALIAALHDARVACRVRAILSALGPTFAELATALGVTAESPFATGAAGAAPHARVCFMYDPEQLALTLRDTLLAYDIKYRDVATGGELRASWRDVEELRLADAARPPRLLPELTGARVQPSPREALRVRHAAAVFCRRVAAHLAHLEPPRAGTARLLRLAGDLRRALAAPPRLPRALERLLAALADMRIVSADGEEHDAEVFVRSLRVTLAGAMHLLGEPGGAGAAPRLELAGLRPLRRFAERAEGARGGLAPRDFRRRFRRWAMRHLLTPVRGERAGREDDLAGLLRKAEEEPPPERDERARRSVAVGGGLDHRVELARRSPAEGAADELLRRCRRAHDCAEFAEWAKDADRFREMFRSMDAAFKRRFESRLRNAVGADSLPALTECAAGHLPCACFPRDVLCRLFVRFRIRAALQTYNRSLRGVARPGSARWLFE